MILRRLLIAILATSSIAVIVQTVWLVGRFQAFEREAVALGQAQLASVGEELQVEMAKVEVLAQGFVDAYGEGDITAKNLVDRLQSVCRSESYLLGATAAFTPFAFDPEQRLFATYYDKAREELIDLDNLYDYTDPAEEQEHLWYLGAIRSGQGTWVAAYGPAAQTTFAGYSLPLYAPDRPDQPIGVFNLAISLRDLSDLLNKRFVGRRGIGIMVNHDGLLLAHPNFDLLREGRSLREVAQRDRERALLRLADRMEQDQSGTIEVPDLQVLGVRKDGWFFYDTLEIVDWKIALGLFRSEISRNQDEFRRQGIGLVLAWLILGSCLCALALGVDRASTIRLSLIVLVNSVLITTAIAAIWILSSHFSQLRTIGQNTNPDLRDPLEIVDLRDVDDLQAEQARKALDHHEASSQQIPTWIYIRSLVIDQTHTARISGDLWQIYTPGFQDDLTRGVIFANADPDAEAVSLEELSRRTENGVEVVHWSFRATLRTRFDMQLYPFDQQQIVIRLVHPDRDRNVLLVPELTRYPYLNTTSAPGLTQLLDLPGWSVLGTGFSYQPTRYNVDFSVDGSVERSSVPVLQYNVLLDRRFLTPFLSHIIPLAILAVLLHGVVISSSHSEKKLATSGFSVFGVLETTGAFFFAIVIMHIDLRSTLQVDVITYLESIYLATYAVLLLVATNSLLFTTTDLVGFLEYRDNLVAKLAYWPIYLGLVLVITVVTFW